MSNHKARLQKLEAKHGKPTGIIVVIYDPETGRAQKADNHPELIGMTRDEIAAKLDNDNTLLLNVVYASDVKAVYIPDNGRSITNA
jgi:hypothetical protein